MTSSRRAYPSDVSDEEWALVAPHLTLLREDAGQREHSVREVFDGSALRGEDGCAVARDARPSPALGSRLSAGAALAGGWLLRVTGRRSARAAAPGLRSFSCAERGHPRQ